MVCFRVLLDAEGKLFLVLFICTFYFFSFCFRNELAEYKQLAWLEKCANTFIATIFLYETYKYYNFFSSFTKVYQTLQNATWSHKNMYLCALSVWHRFTYLTARFAAVSKRNVHWVALKHRLNTWTLARFYYVDIGTYCCVFIALFQVRAAAVQNSNIRGLSLKVNALSCWKYALHQTQP